MFVPGTNVVKTWDKPGFSPYFTLEARQTRVCPWDKPGLSQGQSRGRSTVQKVYVNKVYVPFSLASLKGFNSGSSVRPSALRMHDAEQSAKGYFAFKVLTPAIKKPLPVGLVRSARPEEKRKKLA